MAGMCDDRPFVSDGAFALIGMSHLPMAFSQMANIEARQQVHEISASIFWGMSGEKYWFIVSSPGPFVFNRAPIRCLP